MKDRIAIVSSGLKFGGSTSFVVQLASGFQSLGASSSVFGFTRDNPLADEFAAANIPMHVLDEERFIFEDRLTTLYQKIAAFNPTAVIANIGIESYEMLRYLPKGITRVGVVHDLAMRPDLLIPSYEHVLDGVAMVNQFMVADVRRIAPKVNYQYLAHGIPLPAVPPRAPNSSRPLNIIYFGRLYPEKGTRLFPEIIEQLKKRDIPFKFVIHGHGPEEGYLRETLAKHLASGVAAFSANVPRSELYSFIRQQDIFIMASGHEGGPLTLLEAMAVGLVPVCHDIPCLVQEVVNAENGFRIAQNPAEHAAAIARLHHNRPLLEQMSAAAQKTITNNYSVSAMAQRYLDFIHSIASPPSTVAWPASIRPRPILPPARSRLIQSIGLFRPARRILKKLKSASR